MRSRYSAFVTENAAYLLDTWHPSTRPESIEFDDDLRWYRLDILSSAGGGPLDAGGTVEFRASYRSPDGAGEQHENSRFVRENRRWMYLDAL